LEYMKNDLVCQWNVGRCPVDVFDRLELLMG